MSNLDILSMGMRNLFKRKMRTILTILGVVIGTTAIVIMLSIGLGVNKNFEEQLKTWGDLTIINVNSYGSYNGWDKSQPVMDKNMVSRIKALPHVVTATPVLDMYLKFVTGRYMAQVPVWGIDPGAISALGYKLSEGEFLNEDDKGYNILFSQNAPSTFMTLREREAQNRQNYYGVRSIGVAVKVSGGSAPEEDKPMYNIDPLKDKFTMSYDYSLGEKNAGDYWGGKKPDTYKVLGVGILEQSDDWERSYYSLMNLDSVEKFMKDQNKFYGNRTKTTGYPNAYVKIDDVKNAAKVVEQIKAMGFSEVYYKAEWINDLKKTAGSLQGLLAAIGAVSFFVAAIGIANTMIMAIYERTKEIGVMKVIGAKLKDIGKLFLLEAALIGFFGGLAGLGVSCLISWLLNSGFVNLEFLKNLTYSAGGNISLVPAWLYITGLAFSTLIGVISGFLPALRAMRISAISAIRQE